MKREGLEIEERIAEALAAAAGKTPARRAEDVLGLSGTGVTGEAGTGAALGDLVWRLEGLAKAPAATGGTVWQGLVSNLNPILGGLLRLFGGGGDETPAVLPPASRPVTARYDMGFGSGDGGYFFIDRDAGGVARPFQPAAPPTVVVQVEAMDSRSFLERTPEIAEAFRRVLLESEGMQGLLSNRQE